MVPLLRELVVSEGPLVGIKVGAGVTLITPSKNQRILLGTGKNARCISNTGATITRKFFPVVINDTKQDRNILEA